MSRLDWGNPVGEKGYQVQAKESKTHPLQQLGVPQKHQANSHNICAEDMVQTCAGPVHAATVSLSLYAHALYLKDTSLIESSVMSSLALTIFLPRLPQYSPIFTYMSVL